MLKYRGHLYCATTSKLQELWNYLQMTPEQIGAEYARKDPHEFVAWLVETGIEVPPNAKDNPVGFVVSSLDQVAPAVLVQYYDSDAAAEIPYLNVPSFEALSDPELIQNQWLIHFTDNAEEIQEYGFVYGVADLWDAAWTNETEDVSKTEGYNYAFAVKDFLHDQSAAWQVYGKEAVLFRADGIRVWHIGDDEHQVIFWGRDAADMVVLQPDPTIPGWVALSEYDDEPFYSAEAMTAVVQWVVQNFDNEDDE